MIIGDYRLSVTDNRLSVANSLCCRIRSFSVVATATGLLIATFIRSSATREDRSLTPDDLETLHRRHGFNGTGYHYYIRKDGTVHLTRPIDRIGAHVRGFNAHSLGICYEGGLDCRGRPADTRTPAQWSSLWQLVNLLQEKFPGCRVCGHRDLSPDRNGNGEIEPEEWIKACPCFEVKDEFGTSAT